MNIIQIADALKGLPDQILQQELLKPTGSAPSYLVLSELQRRKDMRDSFVSQQQMPQRSMAEEMAQPQPQMPQGMPPQMPQMPQQAMQGPPQGSPPMGVEPGYADGGEVDSWDERRRRFLRSMGRPDIEPTPLPNIRVPNWAIPSPEPQDVPRPDALPGRGIGVLGRPYPSMPDDYPDPWKAEPGQSVGQSIANRIRGVTPEGLPRNVGETGGQPIDADRTSYAQGYAGPEPVGIAAAFAGASNKGEYGDAWNRSASDAKDERTRNQVADAERAGASGGVGGAGVGTGAGGGGAGGNRTLNIGGEGLKNYYDEIRGLMPADSYGDL